MARTCVDRFGGECPKYVAAEGEQSIYPSHRRHKCKKQFDHVWFEIKWVLKRKPTPKELDEKKKKEKGVRAHECRWCGRVSE